MKVQIAGIVSESITDGPGLRTTLFFQGCDHHCPGCHNPQTWDHSGGIEYELDDLLASLKDTPLIRGITLSGGEPFLQPLPAFEVAHFYKSFGKDVWIYTGFLWEQLIQSSNPAVHELLSQSDVIVDGPFIQSQRRPDLFFRGSANQHMISVQKSLEYQKLILWDP